MVPDTRGGQECARRSASALAPPPLLKHSLALSGLRESPHTAVIIVLSVARAGSTLSTQNSRLLLDRLYFSVWGENMATFVTSNLNTWGERLVTSCARPRGPEEKSNLVSAFTKFLGLPSLQWMERWTRWTGVHTIVFSTYTTVQLLHTTLKAKAKGTLTTEPPRRPPKGILRSANKSSFHLKAGKESLGSFFRIFSRRLDTKSHPIKQTQGSSQSQPLVLSWENMEYPYPEHRVVHALQAVT